MSKLTVKDSKHPSKVVHKVDHSKPDYGPWKEGKRPPGSQTGRYKRFDKSIPKSAERVFVPNTFDVVFGRGKGSHDHPGNKRMRKIISRHKKDYGAIHRSKKRQIAELVYSEITQDGARFLHKIKDEEAYAVVDLNLALQKLSNTLRCRKSCLSGQGDEEDDLPPGASPPYRSNPILPMGGIRISASTAAGIKALLSPTAGVPPPMVPPPVGISLVGMQPQDTNAIATSDPLLHTRFLGGLARANFLPPPTTLAESELLMAPPSLAERELLLRTLPPPGSALLGFGGSLLSSDPWLSSPLMLPHERYNEMMIAEQEYILARRRLRSAALGF